MAQAELAFGRFRLQAGRQLFLDDQPVSLGAKPLNILTALVTADGNVVTKDELIERVWPGMVVEENAIQAHISAIRKVLGEDARRIAERRSSNCGLRLSPGIFPECNETI